MSQVTLYLIMMCVVGVSFVAAYRVDNIYENGEHWYVYSINDTELPFDINMTPAQVQFTGYRVNETRDCDNNVSGCEYWVMVNYTYQQFNISYGHYLDGVDTVLLEAQVNETITQYLNVSINVSNSTEIGIYETSMEIYNSTDEYDKVNFRFVVSEGEQEYVNTTGEFDFESDDATYRQIIVFNSELPKTYTRTYSLQTDPGENLTIKCDGYITCSDTLIETGSITTFTATVTLPTTAPIGTVKNYILLETSYNKSMNITYEIQVKDTPITIQYADLGLNRSLSNMTPEELEDFFDTMIDISNDAIDKLEEANNTKEVIKIKNQSVPYLANKDEIVDAVMVRLQEDDSKFNNKVYETYLAERDSKDSLQNKIDWLEQEVQTVKQNSYNQQKALQQNVTKEKEKLMEENIVIDKSKMVKGSIAIVVVVGLLGGYIYVKREEFPF